MRPSVSCSSDMKRKQLNIFSTFLILFGLNSCFGFGIRFSSMIVDCFGQRHGTSLWF